MQIKEAAKLLNTTPKTLRFYEEKGLIAPSKDDANQYRYFSESDLYRVSTILALREIGVPVKEIKVLLEKQSMSIKQYLDIQRSALYEQWIEMRDMILTIDQMVEQVEPNLHSQEVLHQLANHLKSIKEVRRKWRDRWDFDGQATDYDENIKKGGFRFNVHEGYDEALVMVEKMVQLQPEEVCVDIGIGTGNLGSRFLQTGVKVIGVDQSEKMLTKCQEKHPSIETRKGHFLALPLLDGSVDAIVSSYALHHLTDQEKLHAFEEMLRVLKPGGQLCIADLMFENQAHRERVMRDLKKSGNEIAVAAIEDEYYGDKSILVTWLRNKGLPVEMLQFNDILGLIYTKKTYE
ncbi:MerR family transcriptional regulator [Ornithinibacillus xuwenensis]|uniref:Methyltransferase domain-containing protein n=1 Tax=Ornithinibacillus xuwenensis TaxID=3144668 RepID=A0ABU9XJ49_9BACI